MTFKIRFVPLAGKPSDWMPIEASVPFATAIQSTARCVNIELDVPATTDGSSAQFYVTSKLQAPAGGTGGDKIETDNFTQSPAQIKIRQRMMGLTDTGVYSLTVTITPGHAAVTQPAPAPAPAPLPAPDPVPAPPADLGDVEEAHVIETSLLAPQVKSAT